MIVDEALDVSNQRTNRPMSATFQLLFSQQYEIAFDLVEP